MADLKAWNAWHGCKKYSAGCANCYMYALDKMHNVPERSFVVKKTNSFNLPLSKNRHRQYKIPAGFILRVNMSSDTFIEEADQWRDEMWEIIKKRCDVIFYILTKRVDRIQQCLPDDWNDGYENVVLNITCENQKLFNQRWEIFKDIPAKHKGIHLSPLLSAIDIKPALSSQQLDSVFCEGENYGGNRSRPCYYDWLKQISDDCRQYKVNFVFHSTGEFFIKDNKKYRIKKEIQSEQAYLSKLSCFFEKPKYKLYDSYDGHLLSDEELMQPTYNEYRCLTCSQVEFCSGCQNCGICSQIHLVDYQQLMQLRQ